jgi:hypothetical protein
MSSPKPTKNVYDKKTYTLTVEKIGDEYRMMLSFPSVLVWNISTRNELTNRVSSLVDALAQGALL